MVTLQKSGEFKKFVECQILSIKFNDQHVDDHRHFELFHLNDPS